MPDEYDNPVPRLDYGPQAPRRTVDGMLQPRTSATVAEPGRQAVTGTWWLFTFEPIAARERVEHDGDVYQVEGAPERWEPRPDQVHYETTLTQADG